MFDYELCKSRDKGEAMLYGSRVRILGKIEKPEHAWYVYENTPSTRPSATPLILGHNGFSNLAPPEPAAPKVLWVAVNKEEYCPNIHMTDFAYKSREQAAAAARINTELHPIYMGCLDAGTLWETHGITIECNSGGALFVWNSRIGNLLRPDGTWDGTTRATFTGPKAYAHALKAASDAARKL